MASDGSVTAITVLLFTTFTQGHFGILDHSYSVNTTVGQRVSLQCAIENETNCRIEQIEWKKLEGHLERKIVVYNPKYGDAVFFWKDFAEIFFNKSGQELKGSILEFLEVDVSHRGTYVCELTTFPYGSVKATTHLWIADVQLSARVARPNRAVREGDNVTILCNSTPPAGSYSLWPTRNKTLTLKNKEGSFILPNVRREDSGLYVCQPGDSPSDLSFQHNSTTINLSVNYLDEIECNTLRSVEVTAGKNVTITCTAKASQNPQYTWRRDNLTVSTSDSLHLGSVSIEQAGLYSFSVVVKDTGLQRHAEFNMTVRSGSEDLPPSMAPPISSITSENSHDVAVWSTAVSPATEGSTASGVSSPLLWSTNPTAPERHVSTGNTTAPERHVSTGAGRSFNATLPPFDDDGTVTANVSNHTQPATNPNLRASITITVPLSNTSPNAIDVGVTKTESRDSTWYIVFIVLSILLLVFVILFLYRRHMIQLKMDMPPPFKPPPPPVKYTSVKCQDQVIVQQPWSNGTLWCE